MIVYFFTRNSFSLSISLAHLRFFTNVFMAVSQKELPPLFEEKSRFTSPLIAGTPENLIQQEDWFFFHSEEFLLLIFLFSVVDLN